MYMAAVIFGERFGCTGPMGARRINSKIRS